MTEQLAPDPVEITIAGRVCRLSYSMHAVNQYQRETARIEASRPRPEDPDPRCICGARKSQHEGPDLIRLGGDNGKSLLCARFRSEDRFTGDSLFVFETWRRIDLNVDTERWLVCLWCGMHEKQPDSTWHSPFTLDELGEKLGLSSNTRQISDKMFKALVAWFPKEEKDPNVVAPAAESQPAQTTLQTSSGSGLELAADMVSAAMNS